MKKVFSIIISFILIISLCGISVLADGMPTFALSEETASIGEEVTVKLTLSDNSGLAAFKLVVRFDTDSLEPVSVNEELGLFADATFQSNVRNPGADLSTLDKVTLVWVNMENCFDEGEICEIVFRVKDTAYQNVVLKLDYSPGNVFDENIEPVELQTVDGSIEVSDGAENTEDSNYFEDYQDNNTVPTTDTPGYFDNPYDFPGQNNSEAHTSNDPNLPENNENTENGNTDETNNSGSTGENGNTDNTGNTGQNTSDNNTETNTGTTTETNTGANTGTNTGTNTDTNNGSNTGTNTETNTGTNTAANTGTNTNTGTNNGNSQPVTENNGNNTNDGTNTDTDTSNINDGTSGNGNTTEEIMVSYSDISKHWAKNSINAMSRKGIFKGYEDGTFRPNVGLSRQEMAVSVVRLLGLEGELGTADIEKFTDDDVIADWAKDYVYLLVSKGIFKGYDDGSFGPTGVITREQLSLVLSRSLENPPETLSEIRFNDVHKISDWAKEAVAVMVTLKIVNGYEDQTFRPQNTVTRAETCTMMYKFLTNR